MRRTFLLPVALLSILGLVNSVFAVTYGTPVGVPTRSGKESFILYRVVVVGPNATILQAYPFSVPIVRVPGDTPAQAAARKAAALRNAINAANIPGMTATVGPPKPGSILPQMKITNCGGMHIPEGGDGTLEGTGGGGVIESDPPQSPSPAPSQGSMGSGSPGTGSGTGLDNDGGASQVSFGIDEIYVSHLTPTFGETELDLLTRLNADLEAHGIPMELDLSQEILRFANPVPPGQTVNWGNTDVGFDFEYDFTMEVPEPSTGLLALLGYAGVVRRRRR